MLPPVWPRKVIMLPARGPRPKLKGESTLTKAGTVLAVSAYGYQNNRITYTMASRVEGAISSDEVDWNKTTRLNAQRGMRA